MDNPMPHIDWGKELWRHKSKPLLVQFRGFNPRKTEAKGELRIVFSLYHFPFEGETLYGLYVSQFLQKFEQLPEI